MLTAREPKSDTTRLIADRLWCVSDATADGYETLLPSGRAQIIFSLSGIPLREHYPDDPAWEIALAARVSRPVDFASPYFAQAPDFAVWG
jgi:hypothetical protein